jgi:CRISPR-associated protein Csx10
MKALTYQLRLLEPVLVSQAETGEENSAIGLPFVPGSALRGAVVARYLEHNDPGDLAEEAETRALFLDGTVAFLNAYPCPEGVRLLPRPFSWFTEKNLAGEKTGTLYDWAVDDSVQLEQPKPPKDAEFCALTAPESPELSAEEALEALAAGKEPEPPQAQFYTSAREVNVHIALVDQNLRTDANKVYRYDALAAGEALAGAIIAPDEFDLEPLRALLAENPDLYLGGAHTAGYGHAQVESPAVIEGWTEYAAMDALGDTVIVTLLSDTILRGPDGQFSADLDGALARVLGLADLKAMRKYQRVALVGGFNRKWGLPLVQTWALQAGSVFVYAADQVDAGHLRTLAAGGLGERRAEGFGRIAVNWHMANAVAWRRLKRQEPREPVGLSEDSRKLAQRMAQRHLENLLERGLTTIISGISISRPPENAQLARVRNAAQQALLNKDLKPVEDHLKALKDARDQFERARVAGISMLDWLNARLKEQDIQQQLLPQTVLPPIAGVRAEFTPELRVQYTARLIDGVMKKAIRQNQDQEVGA